MNRTIGIFNQIKLQGSVLNAFIIEMAIPVMRSCNACNASYIEGRLYL